MNVEWTDKRGTLHVLVSEPLSFYVDPVPDPHIYEPEIRHFMNGSEGKVADGPCLGCLPYRFPAEHQIHVPVKR